MATIQKRKRSDGTTVYRAQIIKKRKGKIIHQESKTFSRKALAQQWAKKREAELEEQLAFGRTVSKEVTLGEVLKQYLQWCESTGELRRTKRETLIHLMASPIAATPVSQLSSDVILEHFEKRRFEDGVSPATAAQDLAYLRGTLRYAAAYSKVYVPLNEFEAAAEAARINKLVGRSQRRERRVTDEEIAKLVAYFRQRRQRKGTMPMDDIILFALHSARRAGEITRLLWDDLDLKTMTCVVRDAKHPRRTTGNHRRFKLTREAVEIILRQPKIDERIFPYNHKTISTLFPRACRILDIEDLRFHDLRHEATSRLFEKGYSIVEVQQFTLHESWEVLKRYTHLKPENVQLR